MNWIDKQLKEAIEKAKDIGVTYGEEFWFKDTRTVKYFTLQEYYEYLVDKNLLDKFLEIVDKNEYTR